MLNKLGINKKADLSINMIVIVAISIIVLVVIVFLVINRGERLDTVTKCTTEGGVCVSSVGCETNREIGSHPQYCSSRLSVCCPLSARVST
jgi:hypothetical protein